MRTVRLSVASLLLVLGIFAATAWAQYAPGQDPISVKLRALYPANVDANKEISDALQAATKEHKNVLLVFGASWCLDCLALDYRFHEPAIQPLVDKNYRVVHVDIGQHDKNLDIAKRYETPIDGVPTLAVLDNNGKLLYSQKAHPFSAARTVDPKAIAKFLETWKPRA